MPKHPESRVSAFDSGAERALYRSNIPLGRFGKPNEVAKAVLHLSSAALNRSNPLDRHRAILVGG
jgi:NAD(P)-dependent dehydrogenase (short-subunit alcohol dehydrogenase family)